MAYENLQRAIQIYKQKETLEKLVDELDEKLKENVRYLNETETALYIKETNNE